MIEQLRKYADVAGFRERWRWVVVVGVALVTSLLEAVGAMLVYVLLGVVTGGSDVLDLPVFGDVQRFLPAVDERTLMLSTVTLIAAFFIARAVVVLVKEYVEARVVENAGVRLSEGLAERYLAMPYEFHLRRNSAELIRNAYTTVQSFVNEVFKPLVRIVSEGLVAIAVLSVLLVTAPLATVIAIAVLGPAAYLLLRLVYPKLKSLGREAQDASRDSLKSLQQGLEGVRDIKVLGREQAFVDAYARSRSRLARTRYRMAPIRDFPSVGLETLLVLFIAGFFASTVLVEGTAVSAIPVLGLFAYAALRLKPSMTTITKSVNSLRFSSAGITDVHADLTSLTPPKRGVDASSGDSQARMPFETDIALDCVSFRYAGADRDAICEVDLRIEKGESIGIVGPTGGGKTTLVDLVLGLLEPTQGSVLVDGQNIREQTAAWQQRIGMVPQTLFVLDDTLRRNIALGIPDEDIDEKRLQEAAHLAQLTPVVDALPYGLDTVVGERGVRLSGGQRQRIAIARAVYRRPSVLVFDEGTSALDNETEAALVDALQELREDHTILWVAHRLTTVRACDRIALIDGGRLTDVGSYDQLRRDNPRFRAMVAAAGEPHVQG